ncbi:sel1 repeat family protein [bacterium]|nr:sel1 repeat family protein [Akkermansiaceae bacterium]MDB4398300.1 sel1 repeat family protein [Akkermansiaceae bacterium]MDC0298808.1 sel1 repeat family protein [bacterium]
MKSAFSVLLLCFLLASCGEEKTVQERAEAGDAEAQYDLGHMYEYGYGKAVTADYVEAVKWYRKAANQEYASAQYRLAHKYYHGLKVPVDYAQAAELYRKAAEQGYAPALNDLGAMYYLGKGVPKDVVEGAKWYRKAAEQGEAKAQSNLGEMYDKGDGVPQDDVKAYMFFNLAAAKGSEDGWVGRDAVEKRMTQEQIAEGQKLTREWLERNAKENGE